jgi:hypothetical protein
MRHELRQAWVTGPLRPEQSAWIRCRHLGGVRRSFGVLPCALVAAAVVGCDARRLPVQPGSVPWHGTTRRNEAPPPRRSTCAQDGGTVRGLAFLAPVVASCLGDCSLAIRTWTWTGRLAEASGQLSLVVGVLRHLEMQRKCKPCSVSKGYHYPVCRYCRPRTPKIQNRKSPIASRVPPRPAASSRGPGEPDGHHGHSDVAVASALLFFPFSNSLVSLPSRAWCLAEAVGERCLEDRLGIVWQ